MRKIILNLAITLDGYIEGQHGERDWLVRGEQIDFGDILQDILRDKDAIFYGRISYEKWGNTLPEERASQKIKDAYKLLHSKQKYVSQRPSKAITPRPYSLIQILKNASPRLIVILK